ncbi:exodeoxyribonuclease VII large subunit [Brevibacillus fulvus]|uniref:Exodeoxyribonuclease 7 large subunit n=1 Tax=Brevibacillus fulvus TaxID=1125967 RepID=A0A939BSJ4_9BACL|nr:exodeoxyribonuclease VII large subunit [Brevibacillus fulvus]MBM7588589.1 exodeoxyribonuclease VII large subunit [Brevibacillus fulvus]
MRSEEIWSVSQLNRVVKQVLEREERLADIWIRGEISNFVHHSSGHMYFTLKDKESRLRVVMFASYNRFLKFMPKDGTKAIVRGSISAFERDGTYQLYAREMQPDGIGSLYLAFEQLKAKLAAEGLFATERKRPLPRFPKRVGVVTSPTGAAIRDICTTIRRRFPQAAVVIAPAIVQGTEAPSSIISAISLLNRQMDIDVLIVGRGGGSIEELWAFNDEQVARAIASSRIPVISAVGHETDFTIADFVADVRAATPTAAAELAVPHYLELQERVKDLDSRLRRSVQNQLADQRNRLQRLRQSYVLRQPLRRFEETRERLDKLQMELAAAMRMLLNRRREQLTLVHQRVERFRIGQKVNERREQIVRLQERLQKTMQTQVNQAELALIAKIAQLDALSPLKVMQRGFSLVYREGELVKSVKQVTVGQPLVIRLQDGTVDTRVAEITREDKPNGSQEK